jgi:hypothetical protein
VYRRRRGHDALSQSATAFAREHGGEHGDDGDRSDKWFKKHSKRDKEKEKRRD